MTRSTPVLTISSQVAAGPVGNSAIAPALLSLGTTPVALPTIILSNHPGHGRPDGLAIPAAKLKVMLERLLELGFLSDCNTALTGYFADAGQVAVAADFIGELREQNPRLYFLCDPVIGDDDELYVKPDIAEAIRDRLVPLADGLIPNIFELGWLAGGRADDLAGTARLAAQWPDKDVIVTSIPSHEGLATALFGKLARVVVARPRLDNVPHGTGDLLSGLIAGHLAKGSTIRNCLEPSVLQVERAIAASEGSAMLNLAEGLAR